MKEKRKIIITICLFMILQSLVHPVELQAATRVEPEGFINFANLGVDKLSGGAGYLKLDVKNHGINMTTNGGLAQVKGNHKYDVITTGAPSRVAYQRKLEVGYGTKLSLACGVADTGIDGANASVDKIAWNVMEWDKDGYVVSDSGWLYTDQTYVVGVSLDKTDWSTSDYWGPMKRTDVKYVTLIFRYLVADDSMQSGTGMQNGITPSELANIFPNFYLCYSPFTYTVKDTTGNTLQTLYRLGTESFSLSSYELPPKEGYTAGFKISSSSSIEPNWMNGNTYPATQVNTWLSNGRFYNSLFGTVAFTQAYIPHIFKVTYNGNGGTTSIQEKSVACGEMVDLSPTASKAGYTFIGWNTNPAATTGLTSLVMGTKDMTLYAIFSKTIQVTLVERNGNDTIETTLSKTIYNNENQADFLISEKGSFTGWTNIGWSNKTEANADKSISTGEIITTKDSIRLYALYKSDITLSYDTNGANIRYDSITKTAYYNASGAYAYPTFQIQKAPSLSNHSFVQWQAEDGSVFLPDASVQLSKTTCLKAIWDQYPTIKVSERYFTLEQAQTGYITHAELLRKATATDREDGTLVNGIGLIVKDYQAQTFLNIKGDKEIRVLYQATDSRGNMVTQSQTIFIVDTSLKQMDRRYVRFICFNFFADPDGSLIPYEDGGLESTSIWRTTPSYRTLLHQTLSSPPHSTETYSFTSTDLKQIQERAGR